jgi:hypothetical protein
MRGYWGDIFPKKQYKMGRREMVGGDFLDFYLIFRDWGEKHLYA